MKVLGLCSYPEEAAATRFRLGQFVEPLRSRGIDVTVSSFFNREQFSAMYSSGGAANKVISTVRSVLARSAGLGTLNKFDLIYVQREAMIFGPPIFEWLYRRIGRVPMVLDLDDATYVPYVSPSYGRLGSFFKFFGKTDRLIRASAVVVCGNRFIAEYVDSKGTQAVVIPTVVDTTVFCPIEKDDEIPVIGWIGTHSTFPFLEKLFPVFTRLAAEHKFILRIIGSGKKDIAIDGVNVETLDWNLEREVSDFQHLDIGLYPMFLTKSANAAWINGKSGFKAIQYLAVGVPFVMSPVGVCAEIGRPGKTHYNAISDDDWYNALDQLLFADNLRKEMGSAGREFSIANYDLDSQTDKFETVFRDVLANRK